MPSRATVNSNRYEDVNHTKFDRYTMHKDYTVSKLVNGRNIKIVDKELLNGIKDVDYIVDAKLLDGIKNGDYLKGSLAITIDKKTKGWIHVLILIIQKTHAFFTRRAKNFDPHYCHSFIVTNVGVKDANRPHPFIIAHVSLGGIRTAKQDYIQKKDVTSVVFYRAREQKLRDLIVEEAQKTAYIEKLELRQKTPQSPPKKGRFKAIDALRSIFHNQKHKVCGKHGRGSRPSNAVVKRTAYLIADSLLSKQVLNRKCKPKALYCSAYAMYVFQRALINDQLKSLADDQKSKFLCDKNGKLLKRRDLSKKTFRALKGKFDCEFGETIHRVYKNNKLARLDMRYIMSGYVAKVLDKRS